MVERLGQREEPEQRSGATLFAYLIHMEEQVPAVGESSLSVESGDNVIDPWLIPHSATKGVSTYYHG